MQWGSKESDVVVSKILKDAEFVSLDDYPLILLDTVEFHEELCNGKEAELDEPTDFFFKYIFPEITGKYKLAADCRVRIALSLLMIIFFLSFQGMPK
jgi:hypothetical protein